LILEGDGSLVRIVEEYERLFLAARVAIDECVQDAAPVRDGFQPTNCLSIEMIPPALNMTACLVITSMLSSYPCAAVFHVPINSSGQDTAGPFVAIMTMSPAMRPKAIRRSIDERMVVRASEESPEVAVCSVICIVTCERQHGTGVYAASRRTDLFATYIGPMAP
jgi:hypothetical protein